MQPQQPAQLQTKLEAHPEGQMAKSELYRAAKMSIKLFQMIQDGQELEGWVQAKITKSADYLDSIYHYMEYQMKFGQGGQAASVSDITDDMDVNVSAAPAEEDDEEEVKVKESLSYEEKLQALLEAKIKKAKPDFLDVDKDGNKKEPMKKAAKEKTTKEGFDADAKVGDKFKTAKGTATKTATGVRHTRDKYDYDPGSDDKDDKKMKRDAKKKVKEASTGDYSAKKARAGKDIGKPGKQFAKIADKAGKAYGSKERGQKVAGAVLAKLRKG